MLLAILHLAFDTPSGVARKAAFEAEGHGLYHIHPTLAAVSAVREFPPDVAVIELAKLPKECLHVVEAILEVPRRRRDSLPLVIVEIPADYFAEAILIAPHSLRLAPGSSPEEVLNACRQAIAAND